MKIFECNFGKGVICTVHIDDRPTENGTITIRNMEWSSKPGKWIIQPHIAWTNTVNQSLADEWKLKLMHVFLSSKKGHQIWIYEPGKSPERVFLPKGKL
jgi:hypothetical protein